MAQSQDLNELVKYWYHHNAPSSVAWLLATGFLIQVIDLILVASNQATHANALSTYLVKFLIHTLKKSKIYLINAFHYIKVHQYNVGLIMLDKAP
ncbi:hypothetical protein [Legionella bononiensis]|uniref:Uncharacterized protein n=1 Tax=Legionella bononiensis TaxID=2793102 RepID=A0ABS1WBG6_9GAMM|nr:hypothetical protein [Legionella bononiensis]MBL7480993.1 hypothetical protein [Legionella bononiensis]MBL7526700.1 hypothetical protein [Legionella bononiensis]MBL7564108.1 hypothetical protein [Legionella bononiensis]